MFCLEDCRFAFCRRFLQRYAHLWGTRHLSARLLTSSQRFKLAHFIGSAALCASPAFYGALMNDVGRRCAQVALKFWRRHILVAQI